MKCRDISFFLEVTKARVSSLKSQISFQYSIFCRLFLTHFIVTNCRPGQSKEDIGALKTMLAGAVGGVTLWTSIFPADVIKSRMQVNNLKCSMFSLGLQILRQEGFLALYNGLLPSVLRTIPATATLFVVYEYTKKILNQVL